MHRYLDERRGSWLVLFAVAWLLQALFERLLPAVLSCPDWRVAAVVRALAADPRSGTGAGRDIRRVVAAARPVAA